MCEVYALVRHVESGQTGTSAAHEALWLFVRCVHPRAALLVMLSAVEARGRRGRLPPTEQDSCVR